MLRRLSTVLSALSLLLCAAVVALWVRSYHAADVVGSRGEGARWQAGSHRGQVRVDNKPQRAIEQEEMLRSIWEWRNQVYAAVSKEEQAYLREFPQSEAAPQNSVDAGQQPGDAALQAALQ